MNTAAFIRILLVEDSPSDADVLQETLHQAGAGQFQFTWLERLDDALTRLRQESFDVLLLDLSLPDSSGPETFRRAQKAAASVPIVVLTGVTDESVGLAAVREGIQDYLVKGQTDGRQIARAIRYAIERKQAEGQLRQQQEWLRVTLTSIGDAVIAGDTGGRITFLNPAAESLTGWTNRDALGQPIQRVFRIINEETKQPAEDLVARVLKENCVVTLSNHTALLTRDGREVAIEDSAAPILDSAGNVAGVVLVFHDVSERRRVQAALAAAHVEAVDERNRFQAVMETLPVGVALKDAQGGNIQANRAFEQVWGASRPLAHPVSNYSAFKARWTDGGQPVRPEEWASARAVQKGETVVGQEMEIERFDGTRAFVLNNAAPIRDAQGKIAGSAVAIMDITELRRSQQEREISLELLRLINQSSGTRELLRAASTFFQQQSGCEAVGVRLEEGGDYPYFEARGFPRKFVRMESKLCRRDNNGEVVRDRVGNPVLDCMCGNVISGRFDPSKPFFTAHGSFWTNSTTELLGSTTDADRQTCTRNRCHGEGYESVALIPLRVGDTRLGLLQLNDRRKGIFSPDVITVWERLADQLAVAVAKVRAEESLLRAKEEWERTFDAVPDLIAILDNHYRIVRANQAMAQRLGVTSSECLGMNCFNCVHGTDRPPDFCPHTRTLRDGKEHVAEVHEDSLGGDFLVSTTPLRDEHGRIVGTAHVARDITARKRAEETLRRSREDLNRAQAVAHTGSWRLDVQRNELLWSDETHRIFGIPKGSPLVYEAFLAAVHPHDRDFVDRSWQAALDGAPYDIEHRIVVGSDVKWVRERAELEFDQQGKLRGGFGSVQDITERKQAEDKIRHQNAVLEGINRILREASACDSEEQFGRVCLAVAEEVTESKFGFLGQINAEQYLDVIAISDPGWEACRMPNVVRSGRLPRFKMHGVYGRVLLDGKGFFTNEPRSHPDSIGVPEGHPPLTSFLGVPLKHDGKTLGMMAVGNREGGYRPQDLEALEAMVMAVVQVLMRKRAERAVRAGEERLRQAQKMESIALLAGGVAHDFNNLLVGVIGNASLAADTLPPGNPVGELLERVITSGEQAAHLTKQLLAYSGKGRFVVEPVNLSEVVREVTDLVRSTAPKKVAIQMELEPGLPAIEADRSQIHQVLMNLVINATEAIGNEVGLVVVQTGNQHVDERFIRELGGADISPGRYVFLEVRDTGCGMDEATKAKIFDPFFTTKFQGRGLGLAAVAGIVRGHKGAIQVRTAPGRGTSFLLLFPASDSQSVLSVAQRQREGKQDLHIRGAVLVVDDEELVRDTARLSLERRGCNVLAASSGLEAIAVLEQNAGRVPLVILDLSMPGMSGQEVLPKLLAISPGLTVVISSGYAEADALKLFKGMPVAGFIQKPYTVQRLVEKVRAVLDPKNN